MTPNRYINRRFVLPLLLLIAVSLFVRGCVVRPATGYSGSHFNHGANATWLGIEWVNDPHTEAEIASLASDLQTHQIIYVYVYVSYLRTNGEFGDTYTHAPEFITVLRKSNPALKVIAWYGIPTDYTNLADNSVRTKITTFSAEMIRLGFDGVQVDPEPIADNDRNLLHLLDDTRDAMNKVGEKRSILSISTKVISPVFPDVVRSTALASGFWSATYYREIGTKVDQIALMTYDSTLVSPVLYRAWTRFQVIQTSRALAGLPVQLFIGIPTSEEETSTHHSSAENIVSGLVGLVDGLNDEETSAEVVTGAAIYPYWETSSAEWEPYHLTWLGQ